jgi:hypothetical protein
MRFHALVTAVMVGLVVPVADNFSHPAVAHSQAIASVTPPIGTFRDGNWTVTVSAQNGVYRYLAYDLRTGKSIDLRGATVTNQDGKRLYTWHQGETKYRVIWQPQEQDYVRLQVIAPNQTEVMNRLLSRQEEGC